MIKDYVKGYPCKVEINSITLLGRIIGEDKDGQWGEINGKSMFSIPQFGTPHGSRFKTGVLHLVDLTEEDCEKLKNFEQSVTENFYSNKLTSEEIASADKLAKG